jgi:hypothetical protein
MNIAWGGDVVLEISALTRPSPKSVRASGGNVGWRSARRSVGTSPGTRPRIAVSSAG